ncbi:hypothetical protein BH11BAC5_BH11BAC5_53990 [soil metagenome]
MKKTFASLIIIFVLHTDILTAQDSAQTCKVLTLTLDKTYTGECKNGLAHGQGEAFGQHHYKGTFKYGRPNGAGVYYYDDSTYHAGFFQDGQKEGKGETHYMHKGKADSTIKGFWSGNTYRGKNYVTYDFNGATMFDRYEIKATPETGRTISFEISTTSGSPTGVPSDFQGQPGYVLRLEDIVAGDKAIIRKLSTVETPTRFHVTYDIDSFPVKLYVTMSNGNNFTLNLYKAATWTVRLYVNK